MCDCAHASDVTESINYKLHFLNRMFIIKGILRYFCHKSTFEDKLNVCRQTGAGMQFYFINILRNFKNATFYVNSFLYYVDLMLFPILYFILISNY